VSLALLVAAALFGKLSAVWVLIAGGVLGLVNYYANLLQISNALALWLSIQPADLFFYAFLPPLLVDSAIRIDFFMFRKTWVHALLLAFVMVVLTTIALPPFLLFVLGFQSRGWSWVHGALFGAIIAPTDALAVAAILVKANGPHRLVVILEGESLFNDASGITLFEVFSHLLFTHAYATPPVWPSVWSVIPTILLDILRRVGWLAGRSSKGPPRAHCLCCLGLQRRRPAPSSQQKVGLQLPHHRALLGAILLPPRPPLLPPNAGSAPSGLASVWSSPGRLGTCCAGCAGAARGPSSRPPSSWRWRTSPSTSPTPPPAARASSRWWCLGCTATPPPSGACWPRRRRAGRSTRCGT
jgi:hypothetical protein